MTMENDSKNGSGMMAVEESEGGVPSTSVLSAAMLGNFRTRGISFPTERGGFLTQSISDTLDGILFATPPPRTKDACVGTVSPPTFNQSAENACLPPLVFQLDNPGDERIIMGMMKNGEPEIIKNEDNSDSTPAISGFMSDKGLVYGNDSKGFREPREFWRCVNFWVPIFTRPPFQTVDLKEHGLYNLPRLFFVAYLIGKLKMTAEAKCGKEGLCQVAILAVPMQIKCAQRLRLKEAAVFAGFKDAHAISAQGLVAYYWFAKKNEVMEHNNYTKDFVVVDLFGHSVVFKRSFEVGSKGKSVLVVKAIILLDYLLTVEKRYKFERSIKDNLRFLYEEDAIPVIRGKEGVSRAVDLAEKCCIKVTVVEEDVSDPFRFYAVKAAALLSNNPGNIGRLVQNMVGTTIWIGDEQIVQPVEMLPKISTRDTCNIQHDRVNYLVKQVGVGNRGDKEVIGSLEVNGVRYGAELEVSYELNWEGVWKVVGVSARNSSDSEEGFKQVKWGWVMPVEQVEYKNFGCNTYEECKELLEKVVQLPSQASRMEATGPEGDVSCEKAEKDKGLLKVEENIASLKGEKRRKMKAKKKALRRRRKQKAKKSKQTNFYEKMDAPFE